jgi:hypothetical protein
MIGMVNELIFDETNNIQGINAVKIDYFLIQSDWPIPGSKTWIQLRVGSFTVTIKTCHPSPCAGDMGFCLNLFVFIVPIQGILTGMLRSGFGQATVTLRLSRIRKCVAKKRGNHGI